jgi:hypothetical protein
MADGTDDERFLVKAAAELADYLTSPVLYWPIASESQPLTLGNLLLAQVKTNALYPDVLPSSVANANMLLAQARQNRPAAWREKAAADARSRVNQLNTLLEEVNKGGIKVILRGRAILELLIQEIPDAPELRETLAVLDQRLRKLVEPGEFLWPVEYSSAFPSDAYWFLYVRLKKQG